MRFKVSGIVEVERDEVIEWLESEMEGFLDEDYEPTDEEYKDCAYELFEKDEICWCESSLEEI